MLRFGGGCFKIDHIWFKCIERMRDKWKFVEHTYLSVRNDYDKNLLYQWMPTFTEVFTGLEQRLVVLANWCHSRANGIPCVDIHDDYLLEFTRKMGGQTLKNILSHLQQFDPVTSYEWVKLISEVSEKKF